MEKCKNCGKELLTLRVPVNGQYMHLLSKRYRCDGLPWGGINGSTAGELYTKAELVQKLLLELQNEM